MTIVSTGLDVDRADNDAFHVFQNFPNPFEYETDFYIIVPEKEDYTITIFDLSGKQIIQYNTVLEMGCHNFSFYAGNSGTYVLSIFSMQNQQNIKMEQLGVTHNNTPILKYNGLKTINRNNHEGIKQNSIKSNFEYSIGDELKFKGYATGEFDEIIDTPSESSFYLFNIANEIPNSPLEGMTISEEEQIVWNWNIVPNALGYKWNILNDFASAINIGSLTTYTQTGLSCDSNHILYVWAYNSCGVSDELVLQSNTSPCSPTIVPCPGIPTINYGDDTYNTVQIGNQCWLRENLKYLPSVVGAGMGNYSETEPFYYVYGYNGTNVTEAKATLNYQTYGVLYNWAAALNGEDGSYNNPSGVQGICPDDWHLPSHEEWNDLIEYLGGEIVAGGKLKSTTLWNSPNTGATNESGFSALPGGRLALVNFGAIETYGYWWTTSGTYGTKSMTTYFMMSYNNAEIGQASVVANRGFSVRCVKD